MCVICGRRTRDRDGVRSMGVMVAGKTHNCHNDLDLDLDVCVFNVEHNEWSKSQTQSVIYYQMSNG